MWQNNFVKDIQSPYEYILGKKDQYLDEELDFREFQSFFSLKKVNELLTKTKNNQLNERDYVTRDILLAYTLPHEKEHPNMFYYAQKHLENSKAIDSDIKINRINDECSKFRYKFWKKNSQIYADTVEKLETKRTINDIIREYKFLSQMILTVGGLSIGYLFGLAKFSKSLKIGAIVTGVLMGTFYGEYKYSDEIFYNIPKLKDPEIEKERQDILNYCFSVDLRLISKALLENKI